MDLGVIIIAGFIMLFCDVIFLWLGIHYIRSEKPLGFYTNEKPPKPEEITDVKAWNRKHGFSFMVFAAAITVVVLAPMFLDSLVGIVIIILGTAAAIAGFIIYHKHLEKLYRIKTE